MPAGVPDAVNTTVDPLQIFISLAEIVASGVLFPLIDMEMALLVSDPQVTVDNIQVTMSPSLSDEEEKFSPPVPTGDPFINHWNAWFGIALEVTAQKFKAVPEQAFVADELIVMLGAGNTVTFTLSIAGHPVPLEYEVLTK